MKSTLLAAVLSITVLVNAQQSKKPSDPLDGWDTVPDLTHRLEQLKPVHMPFNTQGLSQREVAEVKELTHALQLLDDIYWRQIDPEALS
jgi:hypothetical protein